MRQLNRYGKPVLREMFGEEATYRMFRFAKSAQLAARVQKDKGGLAAAAIAMRPLKNLGRLTQAKILHELFSSRHITNLLTVGVTENTKEAYAGLSRLTSFLMNQSAGTDIVNELQAAKDFYDIAVEGFIEMEKDSGSIVDPAVFPLDQK